MLYFTLKNAEVFCFFFFPPFLSRNQEGAQKNLVNKNPARQLLVIHYGLSLSRGPARPSLN